MFNEAIAAANAALINAPDSSRQLTTAEYEKLASLERDASSWSSTDPVKPVCPQLAPITDCSNRWNSKHDMLQRAYKLRAAFYKVAALNQALRVYEMSTAEWGNVNESIYFLKLFYTVST